MTPSPYDPERLQIELGAEAEEGGGGGPVQTEITTRVGWGPRGDLLESGQTIQVPVQLQTPVPARLRIPVLSLGTSTTPPADVVFAAEVVIEPNSNSALLEVSAVDPLALSPSTLRLDLDVENATVENAPVDTTINVIEDSTFGNDTATIAVQSAVGPSPNWSFRVGNYPNLAETAGLITGHIDLDSPAIDEVQIRVTDIPGTATAGDDYAAVNELVTIAAGNQEGTFDFTILDGGVPPSTTESFQLTGTVEAGTVAGVGTFGTVNVSITDSSSVPDPVFNLEAVSGITQVDEGGTLQFRAFLDGPLSSGAITLRATDVEGSALAGTNYPDLSEDLVFVGGQSEMFFSVPTTVDGVASNNLGFSVRLDVVVGSATAGAVVEIPCVLVNTDVGTVEPVISWVTQTTVLEAGSGPVALLVRADPPFTETTFIDLVQGGDAVEGTDFAATWGGAAGPLRMRFRPDVATAEAVTVRPLDGFNAGRSLTYTLQDDAGFSLGSTVLTTVNLIEVPVEPTEGLVQLYGPFGSQPFQGLVAVVPPSPSLPDLKSDEGQLQVVGHSRLANGDWESAYVYGTTTKPENSYPGGADPVTVELNTDQTAPPAYEGNFPDIPTLTFRVKVQGVLAEYVVDEVISSEFTGPNGDWDQAGADLYRCDRFLAWMKAPGTGGLNTSTPQTDRCLLVEWFVERWADQDLVMVHGHLLNGACRKGQGDHFTESAWADGRVELRSFTMNVSEPQWVPRMVDQPQFVIRSGNDVLLLPERTRNYHFIELGDYWFHVPITRNATTEMARQIQRQCHIARFYGAMGVDRNRVHGAGGERELNHGRMGLISEDGGGTGWPASIDAANKLGLRSRDQFVEADGDTSRGTTPFWSAGEGGEREGWFLGCYYNDPGNPAGEGIYGCTAPVPGRGWWEHERYVLDSLASRVRLDYRDAVTGEHMGWYWQTAIQESGEWRTPFFYSGDRHEYGYHPWFVTPGYEGISQVQFARSPEDRPWNVPLSGFTDEGQGKIQGWRTFDTPHLRRVTGDVEEAWWSMRSPQAWCMYESIAAWISRMFTPLRLATGGGSGVFQGYAIAMGNFIDNLDGADAKNARWNVGSGKGGWGGQARDAAWSKQAIIGCYKAAPDWLRSALKGQGTPGAARDFVDLMTRWTDHYMTEVGHVGSETSTQGIPSQYSETVPPHFGPVNVAEQTGAIPGPTNSGTPDHYAYSNGFHEHFWRRTIGMMLKYWVEETDPRHASLMRGITGYKDILEGAQSWYSTHSGEAVGGYVWGNAMIVRKGTNSGNDPAMTSAEVRAGAVAWHNFETYFDGFLGMIVTRPNPGGGEHVQKMSWAAVHGYALTGDVSYLDLWRVGKGIPSTETLEQTFNNRYNGNSSQDFAFNATSGSTFFKRMQEYSYDAVWMAEVANLLS